MVRSYWKRKIADLRSRYGNAEAEHFIKHYVCETCGEARLATLTVHHLHGRSRSEVKTLCFNCHMVIHAPKSGSWTYKDEVEFEAKKNAQKLVKRLEDLKIFNFYKKASSLREVGRIFGKNHITIRNAIERCQNDNGTSC